MTAASEERGTVMPARENANWLRALRRYMAFVAGANLVWEFAHMPRHTLPDRSRD